MADREQARPGAPAAPADEEHKDEESFLSRWSRLKAQNKAPEQAPPAAEHADAPAEAPLAEASPAPAPEAEGEPPGDEDMPPLESLTPDSDFSAFMSPRVSAGLRKQALRKLFRSEKFNVISELDDYIDDYRNYPALGDIVTSDMKHAAARLLKKQLEAAEAAATDDAAAGTAAGGVAATDAGSAPSVESEAAGGDPAGGDNDRAAARQPGETGEQAATGPSEETAEIDPNNDQEQPPRDA
ncbi:DUF3306 domain-containing protein [Wenzhouxiangella sp. XN24]|uniref:DUF3306 domain-containing protein n=1 Tax=Wenzhouxiangella sp. XN24 TaxID=2713569 RepID=UPI0013EBB4DF|nr:DUF3306 domain-containing protein [Wenzhouxiangella sp. XN24]NGX14937.1 DUF3306 domain-containing protein [Wenzhouxiangella sp. XN24]